MNTFKFSIECTFTNLKNKGIDEVIKKSVLIEADDSPKAEKIINKDYKDDKNFRIIRIQQR